MKANWTVNGQRRAVDVPDDMPVLWVLRDILNLKGTKFGCGAGLCGSCTIAPRRRARSGLRRDGQGVGAKKITTIEGLSADGSHPVQRAWVDLDVPQCGYCQSGQIMTAVALLNEKPSPTDAEIADAMNGNLCRCGTYVRIRAAIKKAAAVGTGRPSAALAGQKEER